MGFYNVLIKQEDGEGVCHVICVYNVIAPLLRWRPLPNDRFVDALRTMM